MAGSPRAVWIGGMAIAAFVLLLTAMRLAFSPFLEIDEAQFVGQTHLALVYANSHPPLYNWLVRAALEASGGRWALALALLKGAMLAATYWFVFAAAQQRAGVGLLALALTALMPQMSFMAAHTLAHSVLVTLGAAGVVAALARLADEPSRAAFAAVGAAAAVGALGKFNIAILLLPLALALALDPFWRRRFASRSALLAPLVFALLAGPALVAAVLDVEASTGRLSKVFREGAFAALDVPVVGLDGLLSLVVGALVSGGLVGAVALGLGGRTDDPLARLLWRTMGFGLAGIAFAVLAGDVRQVSERYLMPLLAPLPVAAAIGLSASRSRDGVLFAGAAAAVGVLVAVAGIVAFGDHRWARPYDALAAPIAAALPAGPVAVAADRQDLAANVSLALARAGREAAVAGDRMAATPTVRLDLARGDVAPDPPAGWCVARRVVSHAPLTNLNGRRWSIAASLSRPCRRSSEPARSAASGAPG